MKDVHEVRIGHLYGLKYQEVLDETPEDVVEGVIEGNCEEVGESFDSIYR